MNDIEEILDEVSKHTRKLAQTFLSTKNMGLSNASLNEHYTENVDKWIINLQKQIDNNPSKTSILFQHLWRSNFAVKFVNDFQKLKHSEVSNWNPKEKLDFISQSFEYSYHYFILIFLSQDSFNTEDLYDSWYIPEKAIQDKWRVAGKKTSGKNWIISQLHLFNFYTGDVSRFRVIRNLNSHNNIIIKEDTIFSIENDETYDITLEVNSLTYFLVDIISIGLHFTSKLIVEKSAWIYPLSLSYLENESNLKKGNFEILNKKETEYKFFLKDKPHLSHLLDFCFDFRDKILSFIDRNFDKEKIVELHLDSEKLFLSFLGLIFYYTSVEIWRIVEKGKLDKLFEEYNFTIDKEKLSEFHTKSLKKIPKNIFDFSLDVMKRLVLNQKLSKVESNLKNIVIKSDYTSNLTLSISKKIMLQAVKKDAKATYGFLLLFIMMQIGLNINEFDKAISSIHTDN